MGLKAGDDLVDFLDFLVCSCLSADIINMLGFETPFHGM